MLVLTDMHSRICRTMFEISASVDPQDPAEGLDTVLEAELVKFV